MKNHFGQIFTKLLAQVDAVFWPLRDWKRPRPANTYTARRRYKSDGIPWRSGGLSEAKRRAANRAIEEAAGEGLLRICRPAHRVKLVGIQFTDVGEDEARLLCGLPRLISARVALHELASFSTDKWVSEELMADARWKASDKWEVRQDFVIVQHMLLPALIRGWTVAKSDLAGRMFYQLTPTGIAAAVADAPVPDDDPPEASSTRLVYERCLTAALDQLGRARPDDPHEIGEIPHPDGCPDAVHWKDAR